MAYPTNKEPKYLARFNQIITQQLKHKLDGVNKRGNKHKFKYKPKANFSDQQELGNGKHSFVEVNEWEKPNGELGFQAHFYHKESETVTYCFDVEYLDATSETVVHGWHTVQLINDEVV